MYVITLEQESGISLEYFPIRLQVPSFGQRRGSDSNLGPLAQELRALPTNLFVLVNRQFHVHIFIAKHRYQTNLP